MKKFLFPTLGCAALLTLAYLFFTIEFNPAPRFFLNKTSKYNKGKVFPHNYVIFTDKDFNFVQSVTEINGWLMLEIILRQKLKLPITDKILNLVEGFNVGNDIYGWWPKEIMNKGIPYYMTTAPTKTEPDADDTGWAHKVLGKLINDVSLVPFLSDKPFSKYSKNFKEVCAEIHCHKNLVLRIWPADYQNEINIVVIANVLASLDRSTPKNQLLYEENKRLLNYIIENKEYRKYYRYYDPLITGVFLLLFFDNQYNPYLTQNSRKILSRDLRENYTNLKDASLAAKVGVREETFKNFYGMNLSAQNDLIPNMMYYFTIKHYLQ